MNAEDNAFYKRIIESVIKVGILLAIAIWCLEIARPFILPIVWGVIIGVAVYPLFVMCSNKLGGKKGLTATLMTFIALGLLITPTYMLTSSMYSGIESVAKELEAGTFKVDPPEESVKEWPVVGEKVHAQWTAASQNIEKFLKDNATQVKSSANWVLGKIAGAGLGVLQFIFSIIIAGFVLAKAESGAAFMKALYIRLAGDKGEEYARMSGKIIQSVTLGILGVAIIQAFFAGLGFYFMDAPAAGLWTFIVLAMGIVQIGPLPVIVGVAIYMMPELGTIEGILFLVWSIAVGLIDNILKPVLLARGVNVPMAIMFIGAVGGFIAFGFIGLFVGAIVFVLGYSLFTTWLNDSQFEVIQEEGDTK